MDKRITRNKRKLYEISSSEDEGSIIQKQSNVPTKKRTRRLKVESSSSDDDAPKQEQAKSKKKTNQKVKALTCKAPKKKPLATNAKIEPLWQEYEILQQEHGVQLATAKNLVSLFEEGNTIPFIARYRKDAAGKLSADELRDVKCTYDNTLTLKQKVVSAYNKIKDMGKMTDNLRTSLLSVRSLETLDEIYAVYKPTDRSSLKQQIHQALDEPASQILDGYEVNYALYVGLAKGLDNMQSVQKHLIAVVAKKISISPACMKYIQTMKNEAYCTLATKKINKRNVEKPVSKGIKNGKKVQSRDASNFQDYFDRSFSTKHIKPHQIMAINRAEHLKYISVTLNFKDFSNAFCAAMLSSFEQRKLRPEVRSAMVECYNAIVIPLLRRMKRAELKANAEKASLEVFSRNLRQMLMAAPVKNRVILGVDPGFAHGCKLGVISAMGAVLATGVVYPHTAKGQQRTAQEKILRNLLIEHACSLIALGNGTACRETEAWITELIARDAFHPLEVTYTIVNESGASVYSCSAEAVEEFPTMDPNLISAVSLARRVQDPLSELVKVEAAHLGVGMYQHDVRAPRLAAALADVVSECVSFVGVEVNTASRHLLRHVAGLSETRAAAIVRHRDAHGTFRARSDLLQVAGVGARTFRQCAGFLTIRGSAAGVLEATGVHPESYAVAEALLGRLGLLIADVGTSRCADVVRKHATKLLAEDGVASVVEALSRTFADDLRADGAHPLFRRGVVDVESLTVGAELTGAVCNCTSFGSFVDVGVGVAGLLHARNAHGVALQVGDRVEVRVSNLDLQRRRIGLELLQKLHSSTMSFER